MSVWSRRSCRAWMAEPVGCVAAAISDLHPDALELREVVERRLAEVAAVAGLLDAAVGDRRIDHLVRVDPDRPGAQLARLPVRTGGLFRPHSRGQPKLDVVGEPV